MSERYWAMYVRTKRTERYYWHYKIFSKRVENAISAVLFLTSCGSIAAWGVWKQLSVLWAILIAISQVISCVQHLFMFSKRVMAIDYYLPEIDKLLGLIEKDWLDVQLTYNENEIMNKINEYTARRKTLENQFIGSLYMPVLKYASRRADVDVKNYFFEEYEISI